jgi:serine/threonine-protein kinase
MLGAGGMGVVVAAHHLGLNQKVAIKFLLPEALEDVEAAARFDREARAAAKIKGEHIARIMDVGTLENGSPFMVMEYLEGEDLAARLRRERRLPIAEAVELVLQTCEVLAEAHALGIIHRDLKPANLFCLRNPDGVASIKVLDFGISKLVGPNTAHTVTITKTSTLVGSPSYMSPEQIQSARNVDARTDIWSVGVVLYEVLAGRVPFDGDSVPEICLAVAKRRAPPLRQFRSDAPAALEAAILKCLHKDRTRRFSSVAELCLALAPFGTDRVRLSVDRIARFGGSGKGMPSVFPAAKKAKKQSSTQGRSRSMLRWQALTSSLATVRWTKSKSVVAAALALTGIALISADLAWSKWSSRSALGVAPLALTTGTAPMPMSPGPTQGPLGNRLVAQEPAANLPVPDLDCKVDFNSAPVSTVMVDGRKLGKTPMFDVPTSPGSHVVVFEHPVHGRLATSVDCKAGEAKAVTVRLGRSTDPPAVGAHVEATRHR